MALFRASGKMMLRSRGVIFAVGAASVQVLAFGLMKDLDFGLDQGRIGFFDFALPGFAVFLVLYQLQDIMVAVAANYRARNAICASEIEELATRTGDERVAVLLAGDDPAAKQTVAALIADANFIPVDAGGLADAAVLEPTSTEEALPVLTEREARLLAQEPRVS